jgi:hypothetical protein
MKHELIEITIIHNTNIIKILYNYPNIEAFRKSFEYQAFKDIYGDILYDNLTTIEINTKMANHHIFLSFIEPVFNKENFSRTVEDVILMLNINHKFKNTITSKIMEKYSNDFENYSFFHINVVNSNREQFVAYNSTLTTKFFEDDSEFIRVIE